VKAGWASSTRPATPASAVGPDTYAAAVFMVVVTTMATLRLLLWPRRRDATLEPRGV